MRRSEVCHHRHLQDREREGRARAKGSGSKVREVGNRQQKKLESLMTNTKAKIDKDTETHPFLWKKPSRSSERECVWQLPGSLEREGAWRLPAGQWPAETHLESFGTESVLSWPSDQQPGERSERQDSGLGRCRAEHVPGETCPLHIPGQVNPGAGNEMIKGMRDSVFQSKDAEHKNQGRNC